MTSSGTEQQKQEEGVPDKETSEYNVFRDSPLRLMGYCNEIGESFRYQMPRFVIPSYVLSFGYCAMDAASTGYQTWNGTAAKPTSRSKETETAIATFDTLLWQSLASVMIPGAAINLIVRASRLAMTSSRAAVLPATVVTWLPTFCGIGSIPFIVHPIDDFVDLLLDNTTRTFVKENREAAAISNDKYGSREQ